MKRKLCAAFLLIFALGLFGCSEADSQSGPQSISQESGASGTEVPSSDAAGQNSQVIVPPVSQTESSAGNTPSSSQGQQGADAVSRERALQIAMENAGVNEGDVYNIQVERELENGAPIYDIEFETDYGDYSYEVSRETGDIIGADYELNDWYLNEAGGSPVTMEQAQALIQSKVPGAPLEDIRIWEERDDGRTYYEGELFYNNVKYEFEIDAQTGIIFDWNVDLRR